VTEQGSVAQRAVGIASADRVVFGLLHPGTGSDTAVLICPPFGWEDMCSYRSRRAWAQTLAAAGRTTLRIDLPATGESSGSPRDPGTFAAWSAGVADAAAWLREISGARRIVAIGIGLGGLITAQAVAEGAAIDEVVLWAAQTRGKRILRELRAFASLKADVDPDDLPERTDLSLPPPQPDGSLAVGGFLLSAETVAGLEALDLSKAGFAGASLRRALLLGRDGIEPEVRLRELLEAADIDVETASGDGYGSMMDHPQQARAPVATFELVEQWLAAGDGDGAASGPADTPASIVIPSGEVEIREAPVTVAQPFGDVYGVVSECPTAPDSGLTAILLNAGALRRIGPGRLWVELSREWAARGVRTVRLDLEGLGDADGDGTQYADTGELYSEHLVEQTLAVIETLAQQGLGSRFVCAGLCSGAFWSLHAALQDSRVQAAFLLNTRAIYFDDRLEQHRDARQLRRVAKSGGVRALSGRHVTPARAATILRNAAVSRLRAREESKFMRSRNQKVDAALAKLEASGKRILFLFGDNEPLYDEMVEDGQIDVVLNSPEMRLERIPGRDHSFRPIAAQRHVHAVLDQAIAAELASVKLD
jgi:alpha-beta hydrolase superfamily lysophospholipase